MAHLYALCGLVGNPVIKHVQLTAPLRANLEPFFQAQEAQFLNGIAAEINFTGGWTPDPDEILVIRNSPQAGPLLAAVQQNPLTLPVLDAQNFVNEGVRAIFIAVGQGAGQRLLIQNFGPQQFLSTKLAMLFDGNVFREVTEPSFALGTSLSALVMSNSDIKFKSYANLRRIFDISGIFRQATDVEMNAFCAHNSFHAVNAASFLAIADEGIRKSVHAITKLNVLGLNPVNHIIAQAAAINFPLVVTNGLIEIPQDRRATKELLSFLLDKVYRGSLDQRLFITNSTRPL